MGPHTSYDAAACTTVDTVFCNTLWYTCRDANDNKQPQSRYDAVAGKAKEQWGDKKVTDLYQDANKNANATAESAKTKAKDNAKSKS